MKLLLMIQTQLLNRWLMLVMISLLVILSSCATPIPLVTLNQLDVVNNKVNPREVKKYNKETCRMEGVKHPPHDINFIPQGETVPKLHGGYCLTLEDYLKMETFLVSECEYAKEKSKK